tara:strand:+ start:258 stop:749 length:492 start_codon:yes stop_codon:yes gene_type:complete
MELEDFYRKNKKRLVNQLMKRKGLSYDVAEDSVQEAFLNAHRYLHKFNPETGKMNSWFNSILRHTLYDMYTKSTAEFDEVLDKAINMTDDFGCRGGSLNSEEMKVVTEALVLIENPKHRRIAEMFYISGYSTGEIASIGGGDSVTNVTTVLTRVREKLSGIGA